MSGALLPVLWLSGPPGVGKTTVAWELFAQLTRGGIPTGYVDIDQLGICYPPPTSDDRAPEPLSDPGRHRMKARNLDAAVANFRAAGARCVVVSGVVDAVRGVDDDLVPHAELTMCRLRAAPAELRRRLAGRGRPDDQIDEVLRYAEALDRNDVTGGCVDTTGHGVTDVVHLVREQLDGWPAPIGPAAEPTGEATGTATGEPTGTAKPYGSPTNGPGEVLWLCGPTAVGKSTVGWQVYERVSRAGFRAAFVDLDQIGFHRPAPAGDPGSHRLKAGNLAAIWRTFRATGAQRLIVVGPLDRPHALRAYDAALPAGTITLCLLRASREQLVERVMLRGKGLVSTWGVPGDELEGGSAEMLRRVADQAAADAEALDAAGVGDLRVDTDDRSVQDITEEILRRTGWLDPPGNASPTSPPSRSTRRSAIRRN